eukprot:54479_1
MHADELEINKNVARFTIIILTCIYVLILTPLSLYYAHKLWTLNTHNISFVTKRHPRIVIFSVLLFNVYAIIIRPICDISYLSGLDLGLFGAFLSNLGQIGIIMIIIALRVWLLFYDHKHQTRTLAIKWQTQVTGQENKIPWTTKYKYLGNVRILLYICVISSVIVLAIKMVFYVLFGAASLIYATMIIAGFFMVFLSFLIFNVRSVRDGFFVQKELKLILMWMMFMGVIYGGVIAPLINPISNLYILIMNIWTSQGLYVFSLVPTYWVLKQYEKQLSLNSLKKKKKIKIEDEKSNSTQNSRKIQVEYTDKMSLEEILKTKDGFDIFANHLIREFSIENLFFVFEVMQAKNEVITKKLINKFDAKKKFLMDKYVYNDESKLNIVLAWHGTQKSNVNGIVEHNFDLNKLSESSGDTGWYGCGIYLSEYASISSGYGDSLLLCKVILGKAYKMKTNQQQNGRGLEHGYDCHLVVDQNNKQYGQEIVIFDVDQILPCYIVKY